MHAGCMQFETELPQPAVHAASVQLANTVTHMRILPAVCICCWRAAYQRSHTHAHPSCAVHVLLACSLLTQSHTCASFLHCTFAAGVQLAIRACQPHTASLCCACTASVQLQASHTHAHINAHKHAHKHAHTSMHTHACTPLCAAPGLAPYSMTAQLPALGASHSAAGCARPPRNLSREALAAALAQRPLQSQRWDCCSKG